MIYYTLSQLKLMFFCSVEVNVDEDEIDPSIYEIDWSKVKIELRGFERPDCSIC